MTESALNVLKFDIKLKIKSCRLELSLFSKDLASATKKTWQSTRFSNLSKSRYLETHCYSEFCELLVKLLNWDLILKMTILSLK